MGTLTSCSAIASNLYFTKPLSYTENCVTASKTVCPAGQKNVNSNSSYAGECVPCTGQVSGNYWGPNTAWDSNCPIVACSDADCAIGQWKSGCTGTNSGTCVACNTANASQVYSTKGGWSNTCLVSNCVKVCQKGEYISGCGAPGATSTSLTCAPCNNASPNVNYYTDPGAYTPASCPTSPCGTCPNGNYLLGCGGTSAGYCTECTNTQ